jgi:hypothetical protein
LGEIFFARFLRTFTLVLEINHLYRKENQMLGWLRLAEAATRVHVVSAVAKVAVKAAKFLFHSNIGLIGLSALAARIGL